MLWFNHRICKEDKEAHEVKSTIEAVQLKKKTKKVADKTTTDIDRLNKLHKANGITLKIHIAAGGHHGS